MLLKELVGHLLATLVWLSFVTVARWQFDTGLIYLWIGGFLGTFLLGLDHVFYTFIVYPQEPVSMRIRQLLDGHHFKEAFLLLVETHEERFKLNFHNAVFQVVFFLVVFFVLSSTDGLLGKAFVMAAALHLLKDEFSCLISGREEFLKKWLFWPIKSEVSLRTQRNFVFFMLFVFAGLSLFLI